jgi:hypothetical protein
MRSMMAHNPHERAGYSTRTWEAGATHSRAAGRALALLSVTASARPWNADSWQVQRMADGLKRPVLMAPTHRQTAVAAMPGAQSDV